MKRAFPKFVMMALFLSVQCFAAKQSGLDASISQGVRCNFSSARFGQRLIVADFNNDQKPDSITLSSLGQHGDQNVFGVRVCDSGRVVGLLTFESVDPSVNVTAIDVNRDGSPDIVLEERYTQKRIQVWLNDGQGGFRQAHSSDFPGSVAGVSCTFSAPPKERDNTPSRAHLRRGTKFSILKAQLPTTSDYFPGQYRRSLPARSQRELEGPNLSRAPPVAFRLEGFWG